MNDEKHDFQMKNKKMDHQIKEKLKNPQQGTSKRKNPINQDAWKRQEGKGEEEKYKAAAVDASSIRRKFHGASANLFIPFPLVFYEDATTVDASSIGTKSQVERDI